MRVIRNHQRSAVLLTVAFSVLALGILPTALCCQAIANPLTQSSARGPCPHAGAEGDACPLHQSSVPDVPPEGSSLESCAADSLLGSLVTLTGAMPEAAYLLQVDVGLLTFAAAPGLAAVTFERPPHAPPPRV